MNNVDSARSVVLAILISFVVSGVMIATNNCDAKRYLDETVKKLETRLSNNTIAQTEQSRVRILEKKDSDGTTTTISEPAKQCVFDCPECNKRMQEQNAGGK